MESLIPRPTGVGFFSASGFRDVSDQILDARLLQSNQIDIDVQTSDRRDEVGSTMIFNVVDKRIGHVRTGGTVSAGCG